MPDQKTKNQYIYFSLDKPANGGCFVRLLNIKGWAFSLADKEVTLDILINDEVFDSISTSEKRNDVKTAFPDFNFDTKCGFNKTYHFNEITKFGKNLNVSVKIKDAAGNEAMAGPTSVQMADTIPAGPIRANYGEIWDSVANSEDSARHSVAGYSDLDEYDKAGRASVEMFKNLVGINREDVILEIGCGVGRVGRILAPICKKWIGTDASKNMLKYAKKSLLKGFENIELIHTNGFDLIDVESNSIDFVYSHIVFMHLDEWDRFIYVQEAFRILKPGGKIYIDNINLCGEEGWKQFADNCTLDPASRPPQISKTSTPEEIRVFLEKSGFSKIKIIPYSLVVSGVGTKP